MRDGCRKVLGHANQFSGVGAGRIRSVSVSEVKVEEGKGGIGQLSLIAGFSMSNKDEKDVIEEG